VFDVGAPKVGLFCPNIFKVVSFRIPAHSAAKYKKNVVRYPPSIYGIRSATPQKILTSENSQFELTMARGRHASF
jgi:hypothetical protein